MFKAIDGNRNQLIATKGQDWLYHSFVFTRGGFRTAATSKMELFVVMVNGFQLLTIIRKCSILNVAGVLNPPLFTEALVCESVFGLNLGSVLTFSASCISESCIKIKIKGLHKTFWGTTKKCENKLIFILLQLSEMHGPGRVKSMFFSLKYCQW